MKKIFIWKDYTFCLVFCFLIIGANSLFATNIDSLKNELIKAKEDTNKVTILVQLANGYLDRDPTQSIQFAEQAKAISVKLNFENGEIDAINMIGKANLSLGNYLVGRNFSVSALKSAQKIKYLIGEGAAYSSIGTSYLYQSQLDSALNNYMKALTILNTIKDKEGIAGVTSNIGIVYQSKGDLKKAIEIYLSALKSYENIGKKSGIAKCMYCIAGIYSDQKIYDKSLSYYFNAMRIFKELKNNRGLGASLTGIASIYYIQENYSEAKKYMLQALKVDTEMQNKTGMIASLDAIGSICNMQGDYNNSLKYYLQSLEISKENQNNHGVAQSLSNIGALYSRLGNNPKAIEYFKQSLSLADSISDTKIIYLVYQNLSEVYQKQNNYKEALKYLQLYNGLKDSIFSKENSDQINELSAKYESEKKEKEIALLNADVQTKQKDKELLSMQIQKRNSIIYGTVSAALLLLVSITLLFNRRQLKQKNRHQEEIFKQQEATAISIVEGQEKERARIAKDLHDSVGTFLSTLKVNLEFFKGAISEDKIASYQNAVELTDKIVVELRNIMNNLSDETLQEYGLVNAFEDLIERINRLGGTHFDFHSEGLSLRPSTIVEINLYRVGQELLSNCMKYAKASNATLQLMAREDKIILMLEDNGIGFDIQNLKLSNNNHGMGLKNIRDRISFIKGTVQIESGSVNGTTTIIETPQWLN